MEKDININGLNIHYSENGPEDAHPIVLMHGWGCNISTVASIEQILARGLHVYNVDLPGHGKSDEPESPWGVDAYTHLMEDFISSLNIKNPYLAGHSFGGRITILMASRHPEIKKILLIDAAGIKPKRKPKYFFKVYSFKMMKRLLPLLLGKKKGNEIIANMRNKAGSADYNSSSPMMKAVMSRCVNEDLKHVMPNIKASALLIWGKNDTATPLSDAKTMEKLIPDAGLVAFDDCGHYSFLDNPLGFRAVVNEFLKNDYKKA